MKKMSEFDKTLEEIKKREVDMGIQIANLQANLKDCVNELCLQCGQYRNEHLGACDGCRWLKPRRGW
jgi:hypothetical protein